jgi:oligopeptide transport system substrate-binding protein
VVATAALSGCTQAGDGAADRGAPTAAEAVSTAPSPVDAPPGIVRMQGCEPRSLLPADVTRRCGQQVVAGLFRPLVELDPRDATPRWGDEAAGAVAEEITSIDGRRWVVELKDDWTFHDGSPVTAASFVDAWNLAAYGPNGYANAFLFESILGFDDLHCPGAGCEPVDDDLDGLRAIGDDTLEVVLASPDRGFPRRLGHVAFSPVPPAAVEDPAAFQEAPIGNGPFRMEGSWAHEERISLRAVPEHPAGTPGVEGVDVLMYDDLEQAWQALAEGRLDIATGLPASRRDDAREGFELVRRDGDDYEALVVPSYLGRLADDPRLAQALSMAIDRQRIIDRNLGGAALSAHGLVPPAVADDVDRCGDTCRFAPARARRLLREVGVPPGGIQLWFDRAGGQEPWVRAIASQWRDHLRLDPEQVRVRSLPHTSWVAHLQDQRVPGLYPTGWSTDVRSPREYLEELHGPGGLFNFDRYSGADVGPRLRSARQAETSEGAALELQELERGLLADMHHVPLWVRTHEVVHAPRVAQLVLDGVGHVQLSELALDTPA